MILDVTEHSEDKPFLLIDVDGVLNAINGSQSRKTYDIFQVGPYWIRMRHELSDWLYRLSDHYHLTWCTMWDDEANQELSPKLDLPSLPYVPCWDSQDVFPSWNGLDLHCKVPPIEEHLKDRPFAWIDDTIGPGDLLWSAWRDDEVAPTRLLRIDPRIGLAEHHVNKLIEWAERIK